MMKNTLYIVNTSNALSETLNDETIVISLETGNYYTLNESASIIWNNIEKGCSFDNIKDILTSMYNESLNNLEESIMNFINLLKNENLISELQDNNSSTIDIDCNSNNLKKDFIIPEIIKYDDMQEMLFADPIHDVDEKGWPNFKAV